MFDLGIFFRSSQVLGEFRKVEQAGGRLVRSADSITKAYTRSSRAVDSYGESSRTSNRATRDSTSEFTKSTKAAKGFSSGLGGVVGQLVLVAASLLSVHAGLGQISSSVNVFKEFELRIAGVQAVSSATAIEMASLEAQTRSLGETTIFTARAAADAREDLARAGLSAAESLSTLPRVLELASAAELGLASAAEITIGVLKGFGEAARGPQFVVDLLAKSTSIAATTVTEMAEGLKFAAPTARGLEISLEDTAAAMGVLADNMLKGTLGGTGFRQAMLGIINPTGDAESILTDLGISADIFRETLAEDGLIAALKLLVDESTNVKDAIQLAGARGGSALQILLTNLDALGEKRQILSDVTGESERMAAVKLDTLSGDTAELTSAIEGLKLTFGGGIAPGLRESQDRLTEFFQGGKEGAEELGEAIGRFAQVATTAFIAISSHASALLVVLGAFVATKLLIFLAGLGASLVQRVREWSGYTAATAAATVANQANGISAGRLIPIYGAQGQVLSTVTKSTVAASAATFTFGGAMRGLGAAIKANPVGLAIVGLTLFLSTVGSSIGTVSEARAETEAYYEQLSFGTEKIAAVTTLHAELTDTLREEIQARIDYRNEVVRTGENLGELEIILGKMEEALDLGDASAFNEAAESARFLGVAVADIGRNSSFKSVKLEVEALAAELGAAESGLRESFAETEEAERDRLKSVESFVDAELKLRREQQAELFKLEAVAKRTGASLLQLVEAGPGGARSGFEGQLQRMGAAALQAAEDFEFLKTKIDETDQRIIGLADSVSERLTGLFQAGEIDLAEGLVGQLPDDLFANIFPDQTKEELIALQRLIQGGFAGFIAESKEAEKASTRLGDELRKQLKTFDVLVGSLDAERMALEGLTTASDGTHRAFAQAEKDAAIQKRIRTESAKLTALDSKKLGELETAIRGVINAEERFAGAKTGAALQRRIELQEELVTAFESGESVLEEVRRAAELREEQDRASADAAEDQVQAIRDQVAANAELEESLRQLADVSALKKERDVLAERNAAILEGSVALKKLTAAQEIEKRIQDALIGKTTKEAEAIEGLIRLREEEAAILSGRQQVATVQEDVALLEELSSIRRRDFATEEEFRREVELINQGHEDRLSLLDLDFRHREALAAVAQEDLETQQRINEEFAIQKGELAELLEKRRELEAERGTGASSGTGSPASLGDRIFEALTVGAFELRDAFGDMEGVLGDVIRALPEFMKGLQALRSGAPGGKKAFAAGAIGVATSLASDAFGFTGRGGTGEHGEQFSGDFSKEGGQIGEIAGAIVGSIVGPLGTVLGAAIGKFLGTIIGGFVNEGADELVVGATQIGDKVEGFVSRAEGPLAEFGAQVAGAFEEIFSGLEAAIGGDIFLQASEIVGGPEIKAAGEAFVLKMRDGVFALFMDGARKEFDTLDEALEAATLGALANATFGEGVSENVIAALQSGAESLEQLDVRLAFALNLDELVSGLGPVEKSMAAIVSIFAQEAKMARDVGIAHSQVVMAMDARLASLREGIQAELLSAAGITDHAAALAQLTSASNALNDGLDEERQRRLDEIEALKAQNVVLAETVDASERGGAALGDFTDFMDSGEEGLRGFTDAGRGFSSQLDTSAAAIEANERQIAAWEESLGDLPDAIDADLLAQAFGTFAQSAAGDLLSLAGQFEGFASTTAELEANRNILARGQIALQIHAMRIMLATSEALDEASKAALRSAIAVGDEVLESDAKLRRPGGGGGGRRQARADVEATIAELAALASGVSSEILSIRDAFADLREELQDAKISAERIRQAISDLFTIESRALLEPFEETIRQDQETDFETDFRSLFSPFNDALDAAFALAAEQARNLGVDVAEIFPALRDVIAEAFGIELQGMVRDQIEGLADAGDVEGLRELAANLEDIDLSELSPDLRREILGFQEALQAEIGEAIAAAQVVIIEEALASIQGSLDLAEGVSSVERAALDLRETFSDVIEAMIEAEAAEEDLARVRAAHIASINALAESVIDSFQGFLDASEGVGDFQRRLLDLEETFSDGISDLQALRKEIRLAGGDSLALRDQINRLRDAQRDATRALGTEFLGSLEQLGISLPTDLTNELAAAQFEQARATALLTTLSLAAAGAFEGLATFSLPQLLESILTAEAPGGVSRSGGSRRSSGRSRGGASSDLENLRRQVEDQIQAWARLSLGDVTRDALGLVETMNQLRIDAKAADVALSRVDAAFQRAVDSFVDTALEPFEDLDLSDLGRELAGLEEQFSDMLRGFEIAGGSAEQMLRLQDSFASAMLDFFERATEGIRGFLDELRATDPRVSGEQSFATSQTEFRDLLARSEDGDLEALEGLEAAARAFRQNALSFLGGGVGFQEVLDEIIAGLEGIELEDIVPTDIATLDAINELIEINEGQPTQGQQSTSFSNLASDFDTTIDEATLTALISEEDLNTLIEGLGIGDFTTLLESIGALPLSELVDALGADVLVDLGLALTAQGLSALTNSLTALAVADLTVQFGTDALAEFTTAIQGIDFGELSFEGIVDVLGAISPELAAIAEAIGPDGFQAFIDSLAPIGASAAGTQAALESETSVSNRKLTAIRNSLGREGGIQNKLAATRDRIGNSTSNHLQSIMSSIAGQLGVPGFADGGLIGSTGLAMLHGSPSAPERVLSQAQTLAFERAGGLRALANDNFANDNLRPVAMRAVAGVRSATPAPPPPARQPPFIVLQSSPAPPSAAPARSQGAIFGAPEDPPARRKVDDVVEAIEDLDDNAEVVEGLKGVRKAVVDGGKATREQTKAEMEQRARIAASEAQSAAALADLTEQLAAFRRDMKRGRNDSPVKGSK